MRFRLLQLVATLSNPKKHNPPTCMFSALPANCLSVLLNQATYDRVSSYRTWFWKQYVILSCFWGGVFDLNITRCLEMHHKLALIIGCLLREVTVNLCRKKRLINPNKHFGDTLLQLGKVPGNNVKSKGLFRLLQSEPNLNTNRQWIQEKTLIIHLYFCI